VQQTNTDIAPKAQAARFMLAHVRADGSTDSPDWLVSRLMEAGVRPIGLIVDITKYVNLELGQPLHAYEAGKIKLPIAVRFAENGEKLVTLDGVQRTLTDKDLVVADGNGPVALAGVMGSARTEVDENTKEILLEAASFDAVTV